MIHIVGAGSTTVTANMAGDVSHPPAVATQTLNVAKASLSVTTADTSRFVNTSNPVFRLVYTGFVGNDKVSSLSTLPTATCSADATSPAGDYVVTVSGGNDKNYNFVNTNGKLTVKVNTAVQTQSALDLRLYPNPTSGWIYMDLPENAGEAVIEMFNSSGVQLQVLKDSGKRIAVNLGNLPNGIYLVRVIDGKGAVNKIVLKK